MGKKRRSRRSRRRIRHALTILVLAFASVLFLHVQLPDILKLSQSRLVSKTLYTPPTTPPSHTPQQTRLWHNTLSILSSKPDATAAASHTFQKPRLWLSAVSNIPSKPSTTSPLSELNQTAQKPRRWFQSSPNTQSSATANAPVNNLPNTPGEIPKGPYPLTPLNTSGSTPHEGTSWAASFSHSGENLPLHWLAERLHAAPKDRVVPDSSIFVARRKGAWIGCARDAWLVCKGAYRAIKKLNAITIVDTSCARNRNWLPHIISKLTGEFRLVRLTCLGSRVEGYDAKVRFVDSDPLTAEFPNGTDLVLAYKFVENATLISAMRFFKNVKKTEVKYLLTENYPDEENIVKQVANQKKLLLNNAMPPFWFPAPEYEYENKEESGDGMQITVARVKDMFEQKLTPGMAELVDPRKRTVRE